MYYVHNYSEFLKTLTSKETSEHYLLWSTVGKSCLISKV